MTRITFDMTVGGAIAAMCESDGGYNPGGMTACLEMMKAAQGDPPDVLAGLAPILLADTLEIYGPRLWLLYKDICGESGAKAVALLRAVQLGVITREELKQGIEYTGCYDRSAKPLTAQRVTEIVEDVAARWAAMEGRADA